MLIILVQNIIFDNFKETYIIQLEISNILNLGEKMISDKNPKNYIICLLTILILLLVIIISKNSVIAQDDDIDNDNISNGDESALANKYSPIFYFVKGEDFYPVEVEYHIKNSNLNQIIGDEKLIDSSPDVSTLGSYTEYGDNYYLDNTKGTIDDDGIKNDYIAKKGALGYKVYCRVTNVSNNKNFVIQYWMFYAFNKGQLNTHEGDWEMVQILLDSSKKPIEVMYSQHIGGEKTSWSNVEKESNHIKVYVAKGAHANYFRSYQGKMSLANDIVNDNGKILKPNDYKIILLGELGKSNHKAEQDWLDFAGRWGDFGSIGDELRGKRGPHGPAYRENGEMWNNPTKWGKDLNSVDSNNFKINWFFYNFLLIYIIIAVISLVIKLLLIYRRHKKTGLGKRIFSILYIDGANLKSIGNILTIVGIIIAIFSLFYPWYSMNVDIDTGEFSTNGEVTLLSIDGKDGVVVNTLESNSGTVQLFSFPIPFSVIIGLGIFFLVLSTVGIFKSRKLGRKYLFSGIKLMIPIIIILIFIAQLSSIIPLAPIDVPKESEQLIDTISGSPLRGDETKVIGDYGTVDINWGLEIGGMFLLFSGILILIGGILEIVAKKEFFIPKSKVEEKKEEEKVTEFQKVESSPEIQQKILENENIQEFEAIIDEKSAIQKEDENNLLINQEKQKSINEFLKIPSINEKEAETLFKAGFRSINDLKNAEIFELMEICNFSEEFIEKLFTELNEM